MEKTQFFHHELFRRDNKNFTFIIESRLEIGKLRIVLYKRNDDQKRIDLAEFYIDYRKFRAILKIAEGYFKSNKEYFQKFVAGEDGGRTFQISVKNRQVGVKIYDNLIKDRHKDYKNYTGQIGFYLKAFEDIVEFFDIRETLFNWEINQMKTILSKGFGKREK